MRRVIVESPYRGNIIQRFLNRRYARKCIRDCLLRGESPFASHLLYTQPGVLKDEVPEQRIMGIQAGLAWGQVAHKIVIYTDLGISGGMQLAITAYRAANKEVEYRSLTKAPKRVN